MSDKLTRLIGHLKAKGMTDDEATQVAVRHLNKPATQGMHNMSDYLEKVKSPKGRLVQVTKLRRTRVKR